MFARFEAKWKWIHLSKQPMHQSDTCEPSKVRWRQCMLQIWRPFWCFGMPCCGLLLYSGVARLFFDCVSVRMGEVVASAPSLALMRSWEVRKGLRSTIAAYRDLTFIIHTFGCWVQRLYTQLFALASRNTLCVRSIAHPPLSWQRRSRRSRCRSKNGPLPRFWWPWFLFKLFLGFAGHLFLSIFFGKNCPKYVPLNPPDHGGSTLRIFLYIIHYSLKNIEKRHDRFWPFKKLFQVLVECCLILWPSLPLLLIPAPWARRIFLRLAGFGQAAWLGLAVTCLRFVSKSKIYIHCKGMTLQEMQQMSGDLLMISTFNRQNGLLESWSFEF